MEKSKVIQKRHSENIGDIMFLICIDFLGLKTAQLENQLYMLAHIVKLMKALTPDDI